MIPLGLSRLGVVALSLWLAGCGCSGNAAHAKSARALVGKTYGDMCLRSPQNEPDFDATFWLSEQSSAPFLGDDSISYSNCREGPPYPQRLPMPIHPTPTPYSYVPKPISRGTFTLVDRDHLLYRGPDGSAVTFDRGPASATFPCA